MARTADPEIRKKLREKAVEYVLSHGVADLSLRPLAQALGTNARMLVYHFGSREGLLHEILAGIREREARQVEAWFASGSRTRTPSQFLRWYWKRLGSIQARPAAVLIFELYALALRNPEQYPGVLQDPVLFWQELLLKAGIRKKVSESLATLLLAATRGLLLDLTATGERKRINRALQRLIRMLEGTGAKHPRVKQ